MLDIYGLTIYAAIRLAMIKHLRFKGLETLEFLIFIDVMFIMIHLYSLLGD